jgi:cytochrome c oxidase assembly protein subunit 15
MNLPAAYNLVPVLHVMLAGAALALGPLLWVWWRNRFVAPMRRLHSLTLVTLFLSFDLVLFGAFTRLSDSGLGCPDWPGCYGNASPVGAVLQIAAAQSALPSGPVTHDKAWIEMVHRYFATGLGALILTLTVLAWRAARRETRQAALSPWWPTLTLVWICVQGAFGALTVSMLLYPAIVTLHLLGGMVLLVLLCLQVVRHGQLRSGELRVTLDPHLRTLLWLACTLLGLQIALGGWVSTNYAVLACAEFPKCQNSWWPTMDFAQGFQVWRELGLTADGSPVGFAALTAIHLVHRLVALLLLPLLGTLAWRLNSIAPTRVQARWLAALIILQFCSGLANAVLGWPLLAALLHTAGAAALTLLLTWLVATTRTGRRVVQGLGAGAPERAR